MKPWRDIHPRIADLGDEFGAAGPLAIIHLRDVARLQPWDDGRVTMSYSSLAQAAYVKHDRSYAKPRVAEARRIIGRATELGIIAFIAIDPGGFEAFSEAFVTEDRSENGLRNASDRFQKAVKSVAETPKPAPRAKRRRAGEPSPTKKGSSVVSTTSQGTDNGDSSGEVVLLPFSAEAISLCEILADLIARNGSKRPVVTDKWLDAARLLLHADRDARPYDEAVALVRWCQHDEFWKSNILSMPKFRQQYDRLRLRAQQPGHLKAAVGQSDRDKHLAALEEKWRAEEEADDGERPA